MTWLFWGLVLILWYTYFGYPLLIAALAQVRARPVKKGDVEPTVSFIITAYNEERSIRDKLYNTLNLDYPRDRMEIIVASDGSTDRTDEIVRGFGTRGVRLLRVEGRVGKTETQNRAVAEARGEVIVFSDATTMYEPNAVRMLVRNYADSSVGAVGGRFRYVDPGRTHVGSGTVAFWDYETFIKRMQTRLGTITGCSGCIYSVRRDLYEPLPHDIISDLVEPLKIVEKGYRVVFEPEALASEETCTRSRDEFRMRVRVITRGMRGFLYMRRLFDPGRYGAVAFQLVSHKILRWFVPLMAVALYALSALLVEQAHLYRVLFWGQTLFYAAALSGWAVERTARRAGILSMPFYFCVINAASVAAMVRILKQEKDIKWETLRQ